MGCLSHTVSGDIASFRTPSRVPIESLKFHFLPKQEAGTPTPENPIPIEGWNGLEVVSGNRNLFDPLIFINRNANGLTSEVLPNGKIHFYGTCTSTIRYAQPSGKYFTLPPGTYCVKGSPNNIRLVDEDGNQTNTSGATIITLTRTTSFSLGIRGVTTQTPLDFEEEIMVARADSAVDWVKYESPFGAKNLLPFDAVEVGSYDTTGGKIQEGNAVYRRLSVTLDPGIYAFITDTANCHLVRILINDATNQTDRDGKVFRIELTQRSTVKICWRNTSSTEITAALNNRIERRMLPLVFPIIGKNKFDEANAEWVGGRLISKTGTSAIDQRYKYCDTYIPILPNTQYTFSLLKGTELQAGFTVPYYDKDKNFISRDAIAAGTTDKDIILSGTVITPANAYYARMSVPNSSLTTEIQIELGNTRTAYEAYSADNTVYGGYIDPVAGEIVATHKKFVLTGYEDISYSIYNGSIYTPYSKKDILADSKNGTTIYGWSNIFSRVYGSLYTYYIRKSYDEYGLQFYYAANYFNLNELTVENFVAKLKSLNDSGNPLTIVYELATPVHIPISPQDLKAFLDRNNFWSDANDITEVTYALTESKDILVTRKKAMDFDMGHRRKVKWNQLIKELTLDYWKPYKDVNTLTANDGELTLTLNEISSVTYQNSIITNTSARTNCIPGHKYYFIYYFCPSWDTYGIGFSILNQNSPVYPQAYANTYTKCSGICVHSGNIGMHNVMLAYSGWDRSWAVGSTIKCKAPIMVDMTLMFGEGNEPSTTEEFERICELNGIDLTTYQPYDTGSDTWLIIP